MKTMKIAGHESAQVCINLYNDGSIALQSYATIVAEINKDGWMKINGLYSATTRKHLGWFGKMYGVSYQEIKSFYINDYIYNINTGEVKEG